MIKSINCDYLNKNKRPSIDLYERKRISCDINPLYYSLAHYEDFSSCEFSDFEQCAYDDIESVILNQAIIGNPTFDNMNINSNNSVESHLVRSESNSVCKVPDELTNIDGKLDKTFSVNSNIDRLDIGNKINVVNNLSCDLQYDLIKKSNTLSDINSFLNQELSTECNNILDSSTHVQKIDVNPSVIENVKNNTNDCNPNFSNVQSVLNEENISFNNDISNEMIHGTDDNLDVISPHNFETFTVIKKNNTSGDIFCKYSNTDSNNTNNYDQHPSTSQSNNFQTFTVINENIIIDNDDSQKNIIVNHEVFEPEISNDYKTFTILNGISTSSLHTEELSTSSDSILSSKKTYINNNGILDLNLLPPTHTLSQFDTITLLPQSNNDQNELKEVNILSNTLKNDGEMCLNYMSKFDFISTEKKNGVHDSCKQINFKSDENVSKEITNCSNNFESCAPLKDNTLCSDITSSKLYTFNDDNTILNCVSEDNNIQSNNNLEYDHLEKLKSSGESDSTLSLHLEILENNNRMNSPDSLNEDEVFDREEKPIVSNKLEFVPLEVMPLKDNRSPRLSRKYMESSPVISANAYIPDLEKSPTIEENSERKNSSSFFIDFNQNKPKNKPKRFENLTKSLDSSTITASKEKIFSMFIDFNEDFESSESSSKCTKYRKPQTLADRFVRMHSEDTSVKSNDCEDTVTPPPSRMTATVDNSSADISESCKKQSVFMFIENDTPTSVKRRSLPQSSRLKSQRNSWNVDNTVGHKTHHRTHSVNLTEESNLDARMTQSHIETGSKEFNKPLKSFNKVECNISIKVNGAKDSGIGLIDSFVRLSDMDKAPSQEIISSLNKSDSKSESFKRDLKNTELGKCLKRMFPYLKSTEVERILLSKPPHSLDSKEDIKTGLGKDLLRMFLEEIGTDTTIDINGRRIKAHKCILTSRCQYFAAMFSGGWVQSAGNVLYLKG